MRRYLTDSLPHADTLFRLLRNIKVSHLEEAHIDFIKRLIKQKKFRKYLINNCYPVAVDGTQKMASDIMWSESLLERKKKKSAQTEDADKTDQEYQYYVYVLEANLSFHNGMVIPLDSQSIIPLSINAVNMPHHTAQIRWFMTW